MKPTKIKCTAKGLFVEFRTKPESDQSFWESLSICLMSKGPEDAIKNLAKNSQKKELTSTNNN